MGWKVGWWRKESEVRRKTKENHSSLTKAEPNKTTGISLKAYSHHTCCHCYLFIVHLHCIFCELPVYILLKLSLKKKCHFIKGLCIVQIQMLFLSNVLYFLFGKHWIFYFTCDSLSTENFGFVFNVVK